ncbi:helix-turn-helix domain-containing protein [Pseudomonas panipatensis]|uniref:helix-turn-helix domain-containing protein n=1 Tax=Pseudomonas panipatensis TaxID=428992 RepID=UPI0035AF8ACE
MHSTERTLLRHSLRELGISFDEWRQRLIVLRALAGLETGASVECIARDLGYKSPSAFIQHNVPPMHRSHPG